MSATQNLIFGKMNLSMNNVERFMKLFSGLDTAYGTGEGRWIKEAPGVKQYEDHLNGVGPGLGIAPLRTDATVSFAAIDLDEPDFALAFELESLLPGTGWVEKSRSGNAHIFVFFDEPIEAWVPRGIMKETCAAVGKRHVEVFPKQDKLRIGMVGNYINLPYHGQHRPVVNPEWGPELGDGTRCFLTLEKFLDAAENSLSTPSDWRKRAKWLGIPSPHEREAESRYEFGTQPYLHQCAEYVIKHRDDNAVMEGHRAVVYFSMSKMLANCAQFDRNEGLAILGLINDESPDPIPEEELRRIYFNAERGCFTSTGCDDPLFLPYADPECPIAFPHTNGGKK